ncbi:MAG: hypothetical protein HY725_13900 [Candidatus Rokubacteria bacterium]|nr:hypothetical protein [Candidatus Rokubacteria bacterium]
MQLDSVRELKAALAKSVLAPLAQSATTRRMLNVAAQPVSAVAGTHRTIALGVFKTGKQDYELAVRLQRRAMENSPQLDAIHRQAKGELDVRYIGRVVKRALPWHQKRNRPLRIGSSIGHYRVTAGTLGCFVRSGADGAVLILSNNHVLADENRGKIGDPIIQPGIYDHGRNPADAVGRLTNFVKLKRTGANRVDCAVASMDAEVKYNYSKLASLGKLAGLGDAFLGEGLSVAKAGRTTGITHGNVAAFELDNLVVGYDMGDIRFDDQIEIEGEGEAAFSDGGDSGSLVVDGEFRGVALLFAGSDQGGTNGRGLTYAGPLRAVLDQLKVDLLY